MQNQVIVALVDGMRPDGIAACGHPFFEKLKKESTCCLTAQTITRPITLPAHISLFTGVDQHRHTNLDNDWHPYPEKYDGILETAHAAGKKTALIITWEPLRNLGRPGSADRMDFVRGDVPGKTVEELLEFERNWTKRELDVIRSQEYDFIFYYFEMADVIGHKKGWMSPEYIRALNCAGECLEMIFDILAPNQQMIVLADHGGNGTVHKDPEDPAVMTIPIYCCGSAFEKGKETDKWHILDIAPTVAQLLETEIPAHYQGKSLLEK